jgi:ABC-type uncharacterized transport system involved in gliding motility auxiliary subunit
MSASNKTATAGLTALLIIAVIVAVNFLVGGVGFGNLRLDLTEDGLYTLSTGTKNILGRINADEPVTIKFYATNDDRVMPNLLKPHARSIEDLLLEYEKQSHGNVTLEVIHPNPDTDDEQRAKDDEIRGMTVNQEGDAIYLGLSVQSLDRKEILPFLNPEDATAFEYDVSRAVAKVIKSKKTIIGVMSAMPIGGVPSMPFQQQRGPEAWAVVQQLKADYEVRDLPMTTAKIDADITVLLVVHPADISKSAEFAIDQYLLGGGNVIAFVDPQSLLAQAMSTQPNQMTGQPGNMIPTSSDFPTLFKSWGISYQKDMVVADMNFRGVLQNRPIPTALQLPHKAINQEDHVTHGLQSFTLMNAGAFGIDRKDGLNVVTLASSSEASEMIDTAAAEKLRREPMVNFTPSGKKQVLGVHISGKFKTAFPDGIPVAPAPAKESGGAAQDASAPAAAAPAAAKAPEKKKDDSLKESKDSESSVILFSDADMIYDAFCLRQGDLGVGLITNGGNLPMVLNAVELLAGGGDLVQVRNRKAPVRPFTKLKEMRESVEEKYRPQLVKLEKERQDLAEKLSKARPQLDLKKGALIIDQGTMNNIKEMEKNSKTIDKQVRDIRKEVNKEVEFSKTLIKGLNVVIVPLVVGLLGLLFAVQRRVRTAAA